MTWTISEGTASDMNFLTRHPIIPFLAFAELLAYLVTR
jgi:hypothetical protein